MMQLFKSRLGEPNRPNAKPKPAAASGDYRAISIERCAHCQAIARDLAGKRYLLREAPRLPLSSSAANCTCKYRKHPDRREEDRRLLGETGTYRWFGGEDRRIHCARRSAQG